MEVADKWTDERGSVMVETALIFPIVLLLTFSFFEFGMYWRNDMAVAQATREGARIGAGAGNLASADVKILQTIRNLGQNGQIGSVMKVVVYKPEIGTNGVTTEKQYKLPAGCVSSSIAGKCNYYPASALNFEGEDVDTGAITSISSSGWDPVLRCDKYSASAGTEPDLLGVYIESEYKTVTGFPLINVLDGPQISKFVIRIEPQNKSSDAAPCVP